jgi:hypothetical protein
VFLGLVAYLAFAALQTKKSAASQQELVNILDDRAQKISDDLAKSGAAERQTEFMRLHDKNIAALKSGNEVQAHEIQRNIWDLLHGTPDADRYVVKPPGLRKELEDLFRRWIVSSDQLK